MTTVDLLFRNARIADVFGMRVIEGWVGIRNARFVYVEDGAPPAGLKTESEIDLKGRFLVPGLIDTHMHIESSLLTPRRFAEAVLPHGTTAILSDPHEVANVAGEAGVRWMIQAGAGLPLRVYQAIPSCVPATSPELEWTGAVFDSRVVEHLASESSVIALGEVMDYQSILRGGERLVSMVQAARDNGLLVEGHIPTLRGAELSQYLSYGISSDHTLAHPEKIKEQISKGLAVMLQAKSITRENMDTILSLADRSRILLVTDDIEPSLLEKGHLSMILSKAMQHGLPPLEALASATIRASRYLGLRDLGALAPGYRADFLIMDDLAEFPPREVFVDGQRIASDGKVVDGEFADLPDIPEAPMMPGPFSNRDFHLVDDSSANLSATANVVVVENDQTSLTHLEKIPVQIKAGQAVLTDSLCLVAIIARNRSSRSVGLIKNLGLQSGAFASSFAHDSHNLLVVGRDVDAMNTAANAVYEMGGGAVVVDGGKIKARLALPIMGLLSDAHPGDVAVELHSVEESLRNLGVRHQRPFLLLSVMSLSVSPYYKFTDKGIIDTEQRRLIPPWER